MELRLEVLDEVRQRYLRALSAEQRIGYLAGGTALSLQLGHRASYDFGMFVTKPLSIAVRKRLRQIFPVRDVLVSTSDELTYLTEDGVKVTFLHYPFNLQAFVVKSKRYLPMLSPAGIALTKALALNDRNTWRDYVDLYAICKRDLADLSWLVREGKHVFGEYFNGKLFLSQLTYTRDITPGQVKATPTFGFSATPRLVKTYFAKKVREYLKT